LRVLKVHSQLLPVRAWILYTNVCKVFNTWTLVAYDTQIKFMRFREFAAQLPESLCW
jgi:hypothetical protein